MEIYFEKLTIKVKKKVNKTDFEEKIILNNLKGILKPATFTVIVGPSGINYYFLSYF